MSKCFLIKGHYITLLFLIFGTLSIPALRVKSKYRPADARFIGIKTNLSWYGPIALTSEKANTFQAEIDVYIPAEKCCPGLVVLTSPKKDALIQRDNKCMNIPPQNLEVIYEIEHAFFKFDYHRPYPTDCFYPDSDGTYSCHKKEVIKVREAEYAAAYLFYPCQERKDLDLIYNIHIYSSNTSRSCFETNPVISACWKYYNYSMASTVFGGIHQYSHETLSTVVEGLTNKCHKHNRRNLVQDVFTRMYIRCSTNSTM